MTSPEVPVPVLDPATLRLPEVVMPESYRTATQITEEIAAGGGGSGGSAAPGTPVEGTLAIMWAYRVSNVNAARPTVPSYVMLAWIVPLSFTVPPTNMGPNDIWLRASA